MKTAGTKICSVWLDPTMLEWDMKVDSTSIHERSELIRSHELWTHAERRFKNAETPDDRADVISILRRVLNHRLSKIKSLYLEGIPLIKKPSGTIEQLALLGAVKPLMLHKLLQIRNAIEYRDNRPPSLRACAELIEFMWYFLRSTDGMLHNPPYSLVFTSPTKDKGAVAYDFTVHTGPAQNWKHEILGWFESKYVSLVPKSDWLTVKTTHRTSEFRSNYDSTKKRKRVARDMKDDDFVIIFGELLADRYSEKICYLYFAHMPG